MLLNDQCALVSNFDDSEILDSMYFMRDEILSSSNRGKTYIEYYYTLSDFIVNSNLYSDDNEFIEYYFNAHELGYEMVFNYLNPFFSGVLIGENQYNEFMKMSTHLRTITSDQSIIAILGVLESDLQLLKDKNASYVRQYFEN